MIRITSTVHRFWPAHDAVPEIVIPFGESDIDEASEHHLAVTKRLVSQDLARIIEPYPFDLTPPPPEGGIDALRGRGDDPRKPDPHKPDPHRPTDPAASDSFGDKKPGPPPKR